MQPESQPEQPASTPPSENVGTRLLFENEKIRVWDLALAPGESLATHVHRLPYCFICSTDGHLRHQNPDDPADSREVNFQKNLVVFHDPTAQEGEMVHHTLTNIGDAPYQNYVIEFKD